MRLRVASYESCRASRCTQATYESTLSPTHLMQQLLAFVHPLLKSSSLWIRGTHSISTTKSGNSLVFPCPAENHVPGFGVAQKVSFRAKSPTGQFESFQAHIHLEAACGTLTEAAHGFVTEAAHGFVTKLAVDGLKHRDMAVPFCFPREPPFWYIGSQKGNRPCWILGGSNLKKHSHHFRVPPSPRAALQRWTPPLHQEPSRRLLRF